MTQSSSGPSRVPNAVNTTGKRTKALFITGTDTNVGKTYVTCLIARQTIAQGLRVAAYKPVCSGAMWASAAESAGFAKWDDIERLRTVIGSGWSDELICPQRFLAPLAPPVAARLEGRSVDFELLVNGSRRFPGADLLLIEGAGGWLSPVTDTASVADLAVEIDVPILVVAKSGLGTINHTLLTIESIRSRGLTVAGIILNEVNPCMEDDSIHSNGDEIQVRGDVPVLGLVPHGCDLDLRRHGRSATMERATIDWIGLAKPLGGH